MEINKQKKSIEEIEEEYELELDKIIKNIKKNKAKRVLLQFPDGLKPYACVINDKLENMAKEEGKGKLKLKTEFFIWLGSCFGACDVPVEAEKAGIDFIVQFGHSAWKM